MPSVLFFPQFIEVFYALECLTFFLFRLQSMTLFLEKSHPSLRVMYPLDILRQFVSVFKASPLSISLISVFCYLIPKSS